MAFKRSPQNIGIIRKVLQEEGFSDIAVAASLARFSSESQFDPNAINLDDGKYTHSYGLNQWNDSRLADLKKFAGKDWRTNVEKQARFYAKEVKGEIGTEGKYGKKLLAATTIREGARASISLARPEGWSPNNPEGGSGFKHTLEAVEKFAKGDFGFKADKAGKTQTGALFNPVAETVAPDRGPGPNRTSGTDAPDVISGIINAVVAPQNQPAAKKPMQGPEVPAGLFGPAGSQGYTGWPTPNAGTDEPIFGDLGGGGSGAGDTGTGFGAVGETLVGFGKLLVDGMEKAKKNQKQMSNFWGAEMKSGTGTSPSVHQILGWLK